MLSWLTSLARGPAFATGATAVTANRETPSPRANLLTDRFGCRSVIGTVPY
jgi:hypothetical protein